MAAESVRTCTLCSSSKELEEYYKYSNGSLMARCKECIKSSNRQYHADNQASISKRKRLKYCPLKNKNLKLLSQYGLSLEEYNSLLRKQNYACGICKKTAKGNLSVDHCHVTGEIRGLLCSHCNFGIGHFKDDIATIHAAIVYLKKGNK